MTELNGLQTLLGMYQKLLRNHPIPTKSLTSAIIAGLGSNLSQLLSGSPLSMESLRAFVIFGGLVTGPVTHYFYTLLDKLIPGPGLLKYLLRLLTDRLIFSPGFLVLTLYCLSRLHRESHSKAVENLESRYWTCLVGNWKIWTLPQIINIGLVPVQYRVLFGNMVALVWNMYLAKTKK
ncbi:peroxisomal membrane protein 2 [Eurytemora carolleeae]|uniref:peroxisomal membrane protein 2 n=1 Tax=Eurytemora carolleeae TaxID=1294199 RepID=UPI000C78FF90|nr:peroxisomal membrane protein 2 [Eurytemora carolleeae]|eukprot:XP_023341900.1 peroxisomal membrane protein 2-like [Eurytemora affinis]